MTKRSDLQDTLIHDLRGPLGILTSALQILSLTASTADKDTLDLLNMAGQAGKDMEDILTTAAELRRMAAETANFEPVLVNLPLFFDKLAEQARFRAELKAITLHFPTANQLTASDLMLPAEPLRRTLEYLLNMAITFTNQAAEITLRVKQTAQQLTMILTCRGDSSLPDDIYHLFEPQTGYTLPVLLQAGGLGLAYCKLAARQFNGELILQPSPKSNTGYRITLSLPLNDQEI